MRRDEAKENLWDMIPFCFKDDADRLVKRQLTCWGILWVILVVLSLVAVTETSQIADRCADAWNVTNASRTAAQNQTIYDDCQLVVVDTWHHQSNETLGGGPILLSRAFTQLGWARGFAIGDTWDGKAYFGFGSDGRSYLNDLWVFDPADLSWTELASCPCSGRAHPALVAQNGKIVVGMGNGDSQRIGRIRVGGIAAWQQHTDHHADLVLVGVTAADHGFLDVVGSVLSDRQSQ